MGAKQAAVKPGLGVVVAGPLRLQITDIRLRRGVIVITACGQGPVPEFHGNATVFGEDGQGIYQGGYLDVAAVPRACHVDAELKLRIDTVTADEAPA